MLESRVRDRHVWTSIHLVYVKILSKGINHILASIHLVYVRIRGKGIKMY